MKKVMLGCLVGVLLVGGIACKPAARRPSSPATAAATKAARKLPDGYDPSKAADRKVFVREMLDKGIFEKVSVRNGLGRAVVTPMFMSLKSEEKSTLASVVYCWCLDTDQSIQTVILEDPRSGNKVGTFDMIVGLQMK